MKLRDTLAIAGLTISLAACNTMTPTTVARVACLGAETGSAVAVVAAADANIGSNGSRTTVEAQNIAAAVQKTVSDVCPVITNGVDAVSAAAGRSGSAR